MRHWTVWLLLAAGICGGLYLLSAPRSGIDQAALDQLDHVVDLANGETMFWAGGCASCHAAEDGETLYLGGGLALPTPFGVFRVPNISSHAQAGIGGWSNLEFLRAMRDGVSPDGKHYYPAFPYDYYQHMSVADLLDLRGFLQTLPAVAATPVAAGQISFPYNVRRAIGLWKRLYLSDQPLPAKDNATLQRGQYLVRGAGHCGLCHTPRNWLGGPDTSRLLAGAPSMEIAADGSPAGRIPNITPHKDGIAHWDESDIAFSLETGFDPDYDSFGGSMVEVQKNMARLTPDDRAAIAAYLKSVPARASAGAPGD